MRRTPEALDDDLLLAGVSDPMRGLLLQLLLYKSVFMGASFRELAEREEPEDVREALVALHVESIAEAAGLTITMREWDSHPASDEGVAHAAREARDRFLDDLIEIKDSVTDLGLSAAMRAPTEELRRRILALADIDRRHADSLRRLRSIRTVPELAAQLPPPGDRPLGAGAGRARDEPFARTLERTIDGIRELGGEPLLITLGPDGMRHARDEGVIDPDTGRAFGLPVEVDMSWRGECFAVETSERVGYAELLTASRARPEEAGL